MLDRGVATPWFSTKVWRLTRYPVLVWLVPVLGVAAVTGLSLELQRVGWMPVPYITPYVTLTAIIANRVCVRAGLLSAVLSVVAFDLLLSPPLWQLGASTLSEAVAYVCMLVLAVAIAPRVHEQPRMLKADDPLPFTSVKKDSQDGLHGNGNSYWDVVSSGSWAMDCQVGSEYARIYLERGLRNIETPQFCWIVRDMIAGGRFTGVEAGFIQTWAAGLRRYAVSRVWQRRQSAA